MLMKSILFLSIAGCCLLLSCSFSQNKASKKTVDTGTLQVGNDEEIPTEDVNVEQTGISGKERVYVFENDTIKQRLVISRLTATGMDFDYTVENKLRQQNRIIRGTAKRENSETGGVEIEEDEEGNSIPFIEYIYDDEYWLALRIDLDTSTIMRIRATDGNPVCPLASVGILSII
jgi:hypothetical protein